MVGKHIDPSTPLTSMSRTRSCTSQQPGRSSRERAGVEAPLLTRPPDGGGHAEGRRGGLALERPLVDALRVADDLRRLVEPLRRQVVLVHVRRLDHVVVDADQDHVVHLHGGRPFGAVFRGLGAGLGGAQKLYAAAALDRLASGGETVRDPRRTETVMPGATMFDFQPGQAEAMVRGIASAVGGDEGLTPTQASVLGAISHYIFDLDTPVDQLAPMSAAELAAALDPVLARGAVRGMVTLEIVSEPVTPELVARVDDYAKTLGIDENMLQVARDYSQGAMDVAQQDYLRSSYVLDYYTQHGNDGSLHRTVREPGDRSPLDPALEAKWKTLESCPAGSLGRTVWDFYQRRGFSLPGSPGAVDPLLAEHDFVHCVADYGTSATGEIEVFSFIAAAIPDASGFSYLVVILGLFETGNVAMVPGVATASPGHLQLPGGTERMGDAIRRGLLLGRDVMGGVDWFEYVDEPLDDVRSKLGIVPKSDAAVAAGSLPAMDPNAVFGKSN